LISERIKHLSYNLKYPNFYFCRTKDQQEVDWIEEQDLKISVYEFKWKDVDKFKFPRKFVEAYKPTTKGIDTANFAAFILDDFE